MAVATRDEPFGLNDDDLDRLWRQLGEQLIVRRSYFDDRFGRLEGEVNELKADMFGVKADVAVLKTDVAVLKTDVAELKTDVAVLKTDVADTKAQVNRMEHAMERGFARIDARFEQLTGLIARDEYGRAGRTRR